MNGGMREWHVLCEAEMLFIVRAPHEAAAKYLLEQALQGISTPDIDFVNLEEVDVTVMPLWDCNAYDT